MSRMAELKKIMHKRKLPKEKDNDFSLHDIYDKAINSKIFQRLSTGLVFDHSMSQHLCLWDQNYPECPDRFMKILERCNELKLVDRCKIIESRFAEEEELLLQHSEQQIEFLKSTENIKDIEKLEELSSRYDAVYFHPFTYKQSLKAVGSTINLITSICKGAIQNGMAIIRPPGHHAMKSEYCGYCFFNNVAIACEKVLKMNLAKKILIVDWDVHHGQATQQMFYHDPRVVYFSIHRYENGKFWPNLRESDFDYIGLGIGKGYNFNVPLNKVGMKNADYIAIFQQVLLPMAYEFQPDLVVVSAGYDAALGCPEGEMEVTPACYSHLLWSLMSLAKGKVAVVLEGGYCLESLAEGAALTLRALLGDPCPRLLPIGELSDSICETILNVIYTHKPFWKCYQYQDTYSIYSNVMKEEDLERYLPTITFRNSTITKNTYETRNCYPTQSSEKKAEIKKNLSVLRQWTNLNKSQFKLCVVYDCRMLKHCDLSDVHHPEKPSRITSIYSKLEEYGILKRSLILQGKISTEDELLLAHLKNYVNTIKQIASGKETVLTEKISKFNSVYINSNTWISARIAAGSLLQVVDCVLNNKSQSGIAIIRPPGHHADKDSACGFCIFNNVAIAAKYALKNYNVQRILIIDWDVHHGNGTQSIFEKDANVLYISIHRYDNGSFFPNSERGNYTIVGEGLGEGFNVNIPWNEKGMGDAEYIAAFQQVVMPIAYQYNPNLIFVSAGFDACAGDPIGKCNVSPELYGHLTHWLSALANGQIILILEGGYNINSNSYAMTVCSKALLGDPLIDLQPQKPLYTSAVTSINNVLTIQKKYWPNLKYKVSLPQENVLSDPPLLDKLFLNTEYKHTAGSNSPVEKNDEEISLSSTNLTTLISDEESNRFIREGEISEQNTKFAIQLQQINAQRTLSKNIQTLAGGDVFAVTPKTTCSHLSAVTKISKSDIDIYKPCEGCSSISENWICLKCYSINCSQGIRKHALTHAQETHHAIALSFTDLSVWCYMCEAYIDSPILYEARDLIHKCKFGKQLPWMDSRLTLP